MDNEAALLAELRAIASAASSRFDDDADVVHAASSSSDDPVSRSRQEADNDKDTTTTSFQSITHLQGQRLQTEDEASDGANEKLTANDVAEEKVAEKEIIDKEVLVVDQQPSPAQDDEPPDLFVTAQSPPTSPRLQERLAKAKRSIGTPPWKKKPANRISNADVTTTTVVVAASEPPSRNNHATLNKKNANTFQGERGGAAEDAELLALLRGVSDRSGAANRFAEDNNDDGDGNADHGHAVPATAAPKPTPEAAKPPPKKPAPVKPWQQKRVKVKEDVDVVIAAPPQQPTGAIRNDKPPYTGERGGAAEDAELLALLRGVTSGAADRFADDNTEHSNTAPVAKAPITTEPDESVGYGLKSDIPSTFNGERDGAAQDEALLAELRQISSKSSADRFVNDDDGDDVSSERAVVTQPTVATTKPSWNNKPKRDTTPPWKRRAPTTKEPVIEIAAPTVPEPSTEPPPAEPTSFGIKSDIPSTFSGERGGAAEDAELLALLRGVSMQSGAADRFAVAEGVTPAASPPAATFPKQSIPEIPPAPSASAPPAPEITREELPNALQSRDWKVRSSALIFLKNLLTEECRDESQRGKIVADDLVPGLDDQVAGFVEDSNANVLDKAVDFAVVYADLCQGAGSSERAKSITVSLCKKNGLSGKVTTVKTASLLALKLMEVGEHGNESARAVVDALIEHGLTSKKVKVVQASSALLCEAAIEFGAAPLPLSSMVSCIPQMLSHSNPKVRENGLSLLAELCRSFGSKAPVQQVIDEMRPAQVSELDALLAKKPNADLPPRQLRSLQGQGASAGDALASLEANAKELEAKQYAARPAVVLMDVLPRTEYAAKLKLAKWSEKVAGLQMILTAGGEQPYKLVPPSASNNLNPLVSEMKGLLSHTHFAVNTKAMQVLAMLAEGVGEKMYPYLRPLLPKLLEMSKDKKLTKTVASCTDSFFGNVVSFEHILEADALPLLLDEKKNKNALARASTLEFLERCVKRNETAGPRGALHASIVPKVGKLAVDKLADPDAGVRNAAMKVLEALKASSDESVVMEADKIIESLKSTNARAYKFLAKESAPATTSVPSRSAAPNKSSSTDKPSLGTTSAARPSQLAPTANREGGVSSSPKEEKTKSVHGTTPTSPPAHEPALAQALSTVASLHIPCWNAPEDDGGVLAGLVSSKWVRKQSAIKTITAFVQSDLKNMPADGAAAKTSALLETVKAHTKGFKESNVNIMKSILQLFVATCDYHYSVETALDDWILEDGILVAVQKISDKKLVDLCKEMLTSMCTVTLPAHALRASFRSIQTVRSPMAHEEFLKWSRGFCESFGASPLLHALPDLAVSLLADVTASNPRVKREASLTMAEYYRYLGPRFRALLLTHTTKPGEKDEIEKCLQDAEYDASLQQKGPTKQTIASSPSEHSGDGMGGSSDVKALPKYDLLAALPADCVEKLNAKEGKAAWKLRKEALDAVEDAMKNATGVIDSSAAKQLVELIKALRDRLSDTQINLKPLAARAIGKVVGNIDSAAQVKLGKLVYGPLINASMNDIKKPMREASLESLNQVIRTPEIDGASVNRDTLEGFVTSLATEINDTAVKSVGLASLVAFLQSLVEDFPNLDDTTSSRGESLGEKFAPVLIECLLSTKADTRAESSALVKMYAGKGIISVSTFIRASEKLKPAKQRSVKPILEDLKLSPSVSPEKENKPSARGQDGASGQLSHTTPRIPRGGQGPSSLSRTQARTRTAKTESGVRPPPRVLNSKMRSNHDTVSGDVRLSNDSHPFVTRVASRLQPRPIIWPEFPEEPTGPSNFGNLKKSWSPFLPQTSIMKLFPSSGIKKQDDALDGCELIQSAITMDQSREDSVVISQLGYVLKWSTFVLCSKEATVGLQALLDVILNLFLLLAERKYELDDAECMALVPYIIERASTAKGRFHDNFFEIIHILQKHKLVSAKTLGTIGCVSVFERSGHAKARVLACSLCLECIESAGLAGIGKKGVIVAAKALSEEHIPENKNVTLDLLESILERMNGDMQRFARICGPGFDSKSRELLEERWRKRDQKSSQATPVSKMTPAKAKTSTEKVAPPETPDAITAAPDELPALSLRDATLSSKSLRSKPSVFSDTSSYNGIRFQSSVSSDVFEGSSSSIAGNTETAVPSVAKSTTARVEETTVSNSEELGTAAVLRARLLKLKEKTIDDFDENELIAGTGFETADDEFNHTLAVLQKVFDAPTPIADYDPGMIAAAEVLKRVHSALSQQQSGGEELREVIAARLPETLKYLTRVIGFACNCGEPTVKAGMSIQLLSVALATLIALFKDTEIAAQVTQEDLMLLIRETATALLDPRLAPGGASELDDATSTQMVRAINKTTISAACGVPRHTSLQALLTIQQQLCLEPSDDPDNEAFQRRMSRVITKLFARVIRHEEGLSEPFSQDSVDLEALVCMMEDALVACRRAVEENPNAEPEAVQVCRDMTKSLVKAIIKAYDGPIPLLNMLDDLGIDSDASDLGLLVNSCAAEGSGSRVAEVLKSRQDSDLQKGPSIGDMVSAFVNAKNGEDRQNALTALRAYKKEHGAWELKAHLEQLSPAFRTFLEEQLSAVDDPSPEKPASETNAASMSERLRNLRSRIAGSETKGPTEAKNAEGPASASTPEESPKQATIAMPTAQSTVTPNLGNSAIPFSRSTGLARPSPSKLPPPGSFRDRLTAASSDSQAGGTGSNRAQALRARLEAIRHQGP